MSPLISVIVPVYNEARYLRRGLQSIANQTYANLEAIVVDDGSTDGSGEICDSFASGDSRFRIIHQENGGVSRARNRGLDEAKGDWVLFFDPDDELKEDCLKELADYLSGDYDIITFGYDRFVDGGFKDPGLANVDMAFSPKDFIERMSYNPKPRNLDRYVWNKLINRSFLVSNNIRSDEDCYSHQDVLFVYKCLTANKKPVRAIPMNLICYWRRSDGVGISTSVRYSYKSFTRLFAYVRIYGLLENAGASRKALRSMKDEAFSVYSLVKGLMVKDGVPKEEQDRFDRYLFSRFSKSDLMAYKVRKLCRRYLK